ncbi:GNAT family N-acetyltransferase [Albimonas pacifica]|uniref:Acetyltransferase (GNAT) family protein n=1 Tax=Albimonas pacifica TaxID=1114924 RepID=A0A1I3P164_9RHOB|nr:GNAT family N-acetyltransferase [Albimonas pacifica]SFJ15294.1 Acetyltransferase (GNAT) family protein [Albimonas pacifica]
MPDRADAPIGPPNAPPPAAGAADGPPWPEDPPLAPPGPRPAGLAIREATEADAEPVARLMNLLGSEISGGPGAMTPEIVRRDVLSGAMTLRVLLAEIDGAPAGVAVHQPAYETAYAARGRYLQDLAVDPAFRRRGVARALIARLARLTREEGGDFLWWMNMDAMPGPRALYRAVADVEDRSSAFAVTRGRFAALCAEDRPDEA